MATVRESRNSNGSTAGGGMTVRERRFSKQATQNEGRDDRMMSTVDSSNLRASIQTPEIQTKPAEVVNSRPADTGKKPLIKRIADKTGITKDVGYLVNAAKDVGSFVNRASQALSVAVTPDTPYIDMKHSKPGHVVMQSGPTPRDHIKEQMHATTGSKSADKAADVIGQLGAFVAPVTGMPGGGPLSLYKTPGVETIAQTAGKLATGNVASRALGVANRGLNNIGINVGPALAGKVGRELTREAAVGAPAMMQYEAIQGHSSLKEQAKAAAEGAGYAALAGGALPVLGQALKHTAIGTALSNFMKRGRAVAPKAEQQIGDILALPEPKARGNLNTAQTPDVIHGTGKVYTPEPLALPQGNVVRPVRLKPAGNDQVLNSVMERIKPIVTERMTPPLENPNELAKWVQSHFGDSTISLNEVRKVPYEDLRQMAEMMRGRLNMADEAHKAASELGHNLDELLNGKLPSLGQRVARNAQERAYGVYPETLPNVRTPELSRQVVSGAGAPVERVGAAPGTSPLNPVKPRLPTEAEVRANFAEASQAQHDFHNSLNLQVRGGEDASWHPEKYMNESELAKYNELDQAFRAARDAKNNGAWATPRNSTNPEPQPMTVRAKREAEQVQQPAVTVRAKREAQATTEARTSANPIEHEADQILQSVQHPRVRDRVYSYLDEAEKAARERLKKSRNTLSSNPIDQWADHAIVMGAKLGKGTIKASDFTEELVKEFGERIRPHAQSIMRRTNEYLKQQERRASKDGQEAAAFNESGVGDASTFEQKISRSVSKKKGSFAQWWEKSRTQLVDDAAPLEGFEKRVRGGKLASAEDSLYKAARMFKGVPEKAAQIVTQRLTPIVNAIEKAGYSSDDLGKYALAKHAQDVNAAGYKSGFSNAEIQSVLIKYGSPEMDAAQKALVQVNRDMLKELVNNGVVSKELAGVLNERWKNYIPLFRQLDDEAVGFETGLSNALANVANPIKSLKGSEKAVIDPLENMVKNIFRSTNAAERNKVASQLPKLAAIDTEGNFIRKLDPHEEVGRKNVVNVKVNGENVKYEVEPEVYKAMLNLDQESSNMLVNILSKPASTLRAGATLTPDFALRNPLRDINQAFTVSKSGFNPLTDFPVGVVQSIAGKFGKGKLYHEWVDNLGSYGNVMSMDRNVHRQALEKVLGEPASKKFINIIDGKSLIGLLRAVSDVTESATKIGEYRAAIRSGATPQEAAYRSRDIMDFARAGTGIRPINKVVAFLNANIQGNSKLIRSIKENPAGTIARAVTSVTLPTVGVFMMQKYMSNDTQRETIDNAPGWQKQAFWLVPVPNTDKVARLPKPYGLNLIFANPVEHALEFFFKKDKAAFDGFAGETMKGLALPTQISGLLPMYEGMSNYSWFRQGDIIPQREQGLKYGDQYDPVRTTETAKLLAKGAEKLTGGKGAFKNFSSPRIMDNTIQGLTAGLGKYATDAIDSMLMGQVPFTGWKVAPALVSRPAAPSKNLEQRPLLRSFLVDPNQGGKLMDKFYTEIDKLTKEKSSNKLNDKTFGGTLGNPFYLEKAKEGTLKSLNKASTNVSGINKEIRSIESSMTLTPQQKRQQIDALIAQRMVIIKDSVSSLAK